MYSKLLVVLAPAVPFTLLPTYQDNFDYISENSTAAIPVPCVKNTSSSPGVGTLNLLPPIVVGACPLAVDLVGYL